MLRRLSLKREKELFTSQQEKGNIENFEDLLSYFYLSRMTTDKVIKSLNVKTRTEKDNELDKYLKLNSQRRAWFELELCREVDRSYKEYLQMLRYHAADGYLDKTSKCYRAILDKYNLLNYNTYKLGKVKKDKQEFKLFKFLLQEKLLSEAEVIYISSKKASNKNKLYFCISRNPVDYLFCATNQNFSSCESLSSDYEGAFYMGLGSLSLDPNRCIIFITDGKTRDYITKNLSFSHFGYSSRSWGVWLSDNKIFIVRYYPQELICFERLLSSIHLDSLSYSKKGDLKSPIKSKHIFYLPRFQDKSYSFIYIDNMGLEITSKGYAEYNSHYGITGCISDKFDWSGGFEELDDWDTLFSNSRYYCCQCDSRLHEDDTWFNNNGEAYCQSCFEEEYSHCYSCRRATFNDDAYLCEGNITLCQDCFDIHGTYCEECNRYFYKQAMYSIIDLDKFVCDECISLYHYCDKCKCSYNNFCNCQKLLKLNKKTKIIPLGDNTTSIMSEKTKIIPLVNDSPTSTMDDWWGIARFVQRNINEVDDEIS